MAEEISPHVLSTKLSAPAPSGALVARPRLLRRLQEAWALPLACIIAPAGSGKTTLLRSWLATSSLPVAWLTLDDADNDPLQFWRYVLAALAPHTADLCAAEMLAGRRADEARDIAAEASHALAAVPHDLMLTLDDFHRITNPLVHASLEWLLDHQPPRLHLIMASRAEPPLPLARMRARGQLVEIRADDLRFTVEETAEWLCGRLHLALTAEQVAQIVARTEGWSAGVQLVGMALQRRAVVEAFLARFTGNHRDIVDYLGAEVLRREPGTVQRFLRRVAVLERFNASLCAAVTLENDAQVVLDHAEAANLFLVPLDDEREWYRFHALFAEFLRGQLAQTEPELIPVLHRRASDWYAAHGLAGEAVEHALAAGDFPRVADLIAACAEEQMKVGALTTLLRWLEALPDEMARLRPDLALVKAAALINQGYLDAADACLDDAERHVRPAGRGYTSGIQGTSGEVLAARAIAAAYRGNVATMQAMTARALPLLPPENLFFRSVVAAGAAAGYWWSGDFTAAAAAFSEARRLGELARMPHVVVACLAGEGYVQFLRGALVEAMATFRQAIRRGKTPDGAEIPIVAMAYCGLGAVLRQRNDFAEAERMFAHSMANFGHLGDASVLVLMYLNLMSIAQARGDHSLALAHLDTAEEAAIQAGATHFLPCIAAYRACAWLRRGDLVAATHWLESAQETLAAPVTYLSEMEHLIAVRVLLAQGKSDEALACLARLQPLAEHNGRVASGHEMRMLAALAHHCRGDEDTACRLLAEALAWAEPGNFARLFLDEGEPMRELLHALAAQSDAPYPIPRGYIRHLLTVMEAGHEQSGVVAGAVPTIPSTTLIEPLNAREREVLAHLAGGLSNQDIARQLVIAPTTVKWHIKHLFAKLGVHSRTQAIARARQLGLLA